MTIKESEKWPDVRSKLKLSAKCRPPIFTWSTLSPWNLLHWILFLELFSALFATCIIAFVLKTSSNRKSRLPDRKWKIQTGSWVVVVYLTYRYSSFVCINVNNLINKNNLNMFIYLQYLFVSFVVWFVVMKLKHFFCTFGASSESFSPSSHRK